MNDHFSGNAIAALAEAAGIIPGYWDVHGQYHAATEQTMRALLAAMGFEADSEEAAARSLRRFEQRRAERMSPPAVCADAGEPEISIELYLSEHPSNYRWQVRTESGRSADGLLLQCPEIPESATEFDGRTYRRHRLTINYPLPVGYHRFILISGSRIAAETLVIASPKKCWIPEPFTAGERTWGVSAQLYSTFSESSWGVGDLGDLRGLIDWTARLGAGCIGVNPLHALALSPSPQVSPYSASNRAAYHILYVNLHDAARFLHADYEQKLRRLEPEKQNGELIDYPAAAKAKLDALAVLFADFTADRRPAVQSLKRAFDAYCRQRGEWLYQFSLYSTLQEFFGSRDGSLWGWPVWPEEYRDPASAAVAAFAGEQAERIKFYQFAQWILESQLAELEMHCREQGLWLGLYLDLALGADSGSFETWWNRGCYALAASAGAPPDLLAPQGQDWGLPPWIPERLREAGYRPFLEVIRAAMRYAGALRIDHVMSIMRLYWVHAGGGAYVANYLDELLGIIAIESNRSRCCVIGEDLGTVPEEIRTAMQNRGILSYKVLFFEKKDDGTFLKPEEYPPLALVTASTHDLPTMRGYWEGSDLELRRELALHDPQVLEQLASWRREDWLALQQALAPDRPADPAKGADGRLPTEEFINLAQIYLAKTPSYLQVLQLEDLIGQSEQANLPGTTDEHPNWRRRLKLSVEELASSAEITSFLSAINRLRSG